jgi:ABC-type multidrug transport system fused ATPase/permease subunit
VQVIFCAIMGGTNMGNMPDLAVARRGANAVRTVLAECTFDPDAKPDGALIQQMGDAAPRVQFDNVDFVYPTRPEKQVLQGFSLDIAPGTAVALVQFFNKQESKQTGL